MKDKNKYKFNKNRDEKNQYQLKAKTFKAKKSLGQNFLVDELTIDFISNLANSEDEVLEIGAGLGFVTNNLVDNVKKLVALEIDNDAISVLKKNLSHKQNFHLIEQDVLKTQISSLPFEFKNKIKVIANIPYYITSPIILHLLGEIDDISNENRKLIKEINLMVQYEVAKRIVANENSLNKEYGQLSILCQMFCDVEILKFVPKNYFSPAPKVDSAIVRFVIKDEPKVPITRLLRRTIKAIFSARRKNVKNSLLNGGFVEVEQALKKAGIEPVSRGEKLSIQEIHKLSVALEEFN